MGLLGVGLLFVGYILVYGSIAAHGQFALSPWDGLTKDAYDEGAQGDTA